MDCPACAGPLQRRDVAGERLDRCGGCGGVVIGRPALARLREARASAAALGDAPASRAAAPTGKAVIRTCPGCGESMLGFAYGGGNTRVEGCDPCDHLFLERGELAAVLDEARHGIALDETAQQALHQHRAWGAFGEIAGAEAGLAASGVVALYLFLRMVAEIGASAFTVSLAAALAAGLFVTWRGKMRRQKERAGERLDRLKEAELWRLEEGARAAQPTRPEERSAPAVAPAAAPPARAAPPVAARAPRKSAACPFCGAKLPAGTTHCSACDSDFG